MLLLEDVPESGYVAKASRETAQGKTEAWTTTEGEKESAAKE
jgi:hypothetical protein